MAKSNALELSIRIAGKVDNSLTAAIKTAKNQTSGLARSVSTFAKTSAAALVGVTAAVVGTAATCGFLSTHSVRRATFSAPVIINSGFNFYPRPP